MPFTFALHSYIHRGIRPYVATPAHAHRSRSSRGIVIEEITKFIRVGLGVVRYVVVQVVARVLRVHASAYSGQHAHSLRARANMRRSLTMILPQTMCRKVDLLAFGAAVESAATRTLDELVEAQTHTYIAADMMHEILVSKYG